MEYFTLINSVLLVILSLFMYFFSLKVALQDILRKGIWAVTIGGIVLALAHLLESIALMLQMEQDMVTGIHHAVVLLGFFLMAMGVARLSKKPN